MVLDIHEDNILQEGIAGLRTINKRKQRLDCGPLSHKVKGNNLLNKVGAHIAELGLDKVLKDVHT